MRTKTKFYDECDDIVESRGTILKAASDNKCLGPRRCVNGQSSTDGLPHVGHDPFDTCTCSAKQNTASNTYTIENRYKRQDCEGSCEIFATAAKDCRVQRATLNGKRKVCGKYTLNRVKGQYNEARKFASTVQDTTDEIE